MKLKKFFNYANSVYQIGEQINSLKRKNLKSKIVPKTCAKMLITGFLCQNRSINEIKETTYVSKNFKNIFEPKETQAKTHGLRDCIIDTDYQQYRKINENMINKLKENKFFRTNLLDGLSVVGVDGVEEFETNKNIEGLPERNHKDGRISKYYKTLGIMSIGEKSQIMIRLEELQAKEGNEITKKIEEENENKRVSESTITEKIKAEGEITVLKRILPEINKIMGKRCDVIVGDALFDKAPVMNAIKKEGIEAVARTKDVRRAIYKDAMGLFNSRDADLIYEEVEKQTKTEIKYSKESHKKNKIKKQIERVKRDITEAKIGETITIKTKNTGQRKIKKKITETEKIIKKVHVWSDIFDMENYEYRKSKICEI